MISFVDTHSHIDLPDFDEDREEMLNRALAAGVHAIVLIGFDPERWRSTERLCDAYPFLRRSAGVHPNEAARWSAEMRTALDRELGRGQALAVGEIGLDFYRDSAPPELQRVAFREQLELAAHYGLPIVIHQRSAEQELLDTLAEFAPVRGVMHCFSGDTAFAEACLNVGLHLGVGGVATYPRSDSIRDALANPPLDRLVLETDSPYLAPKSQRGKRNEPSFAVEALRTLATVRGVDEETIAGETTAAAAALFGDEINRAVTAGRALAKERAV